MRQGEERKTEYEGETRCIPTAPYLHLAGAVFDRGCRDFATDWFRNKTEYDSEPMRWFYDDIRRPFSFVWLCELFDITPSEARSRVIKNVRELCDRNELKRRENEPDNLCA